MRGRTVIAIGAVLTFWAVLYFRFHIHELGEIVVTYSTFYPLLHRHPDILYRHPENETSLANSTLASAPVVVPKIINQIALGNASVSKYRAAIQSCTDLHPGWKHQIWSDQNATDFMAEHYPEILPHYINYPQNIQRANILRYALLHHAGGIYVDLDVTCRVALDDTPLVRLPFVSPGAHPAGVNNAFIAAQPGHPFLEQLLGNVPSHDLKWGLPMRIPYVENMLSTGCMFFSNQWMAYVRALLAGRQDQSVFILSDENGDMAPHMLRGKVTTPIFVHGGASSWHGWDAALFLTIGDHYLLYLTGLFTTVGLLWVCLQLRRSHRHRGCCFFGRMSSRGSGSPVRRERKPSIIGDAMA
ncbi:Inositol phosphoceramide mannosyltransferase 3 [Escovopsis weberi]|uniref:Inositol phosphoceramide mannosyltransferase 3 n=1 Tax=Escovopsis weberi TaxID=150374 RepID=A0A0M9VVL7_ESCWE|nr:Inositol phosphoceramide mannosyltransferase 3 [Escovopsis weberi]